MKLGIGRGEVDQIRRMRQHRTQRALSGEDGDVLVRHRLSLPLIAILGKERDGRGVDLRGAVEDGVQAAPGRNMRAEEIARKLRLTPRNCASSDVSVRKSETGHGGARNEIDR